MPFLTSARFLTVARFITGAHFLTGSGFEYDIAHRRSVSVMCMLYKIRYKPMHPLYLALPGSYVPEVFGFGFV